MIGVEVNGAEGIALVGRAVRSLGADRTIVTNMAKEIKAASLPLRQAMKANALSTLPKRGGLNQWAAAARINTTVRRGASSAGVSITVGKAARGRGKGRKHDIKRLDAGKLRAPLFGNRRYWHMQAVTPGAFTRPVESWAGREFRDAIVVAVDNAVKEVL